MGEPGKLMWKAGKLEKGRAGTELVLKNAGWKKAGIGSGLFRSFHIPHKKKPPPAAKRSGGRRELSEKQAGRSGFPPLDPANQKSSLVV
jgi:hypothetical protein